MIKLDKHIETIRSSTARLSSLSVASANAIASVLSKHYTTVVVTIIDNFSDLENLVSRRPDLVFLGMNFVPNNPVLGLLDPDGLWVTTYLDEHNINYTGSGQAAHEMAVNKALAKQRVMDNGLKTSPFFVIKQRQIPSKKRLTLNYPVFIKPVDRGGGLGIDSDSVAYSFEQLCAKVQSIATNFQSDSLLEEYLPGREFSVAILKDGLSGQLVALPLELVAPADTRGVQILSGQVKSADAEKVSLVTDVVMKDRIANLAIDVFKALGGRDYGRIDIRLDGSGVPQFLEANLIPSLIQNYGSFPKACVLNIGLQYEPMILNIVRLGLIRNLDNSDYDDEPTSLSMTGASVLPV